eukprot:PhM_4_TR12785/c0_g1_i1/m.100801/K02258/COX11; cytochrome c oxidase assembly protein subunit 11
MMRRCRFLRCMVPPPPPSPSSSATSSSSSSTSNLNSAMPPDSTAATEKQQQPPKRRFRLHHTNENSWEETRNNSQAFFSGFVSVSLMSLGLTFLFVPLYRLYCQVGGRGFDTRYWTAPTEEGMPSQGDDDVKPRLLTVFFTGDVGQSFPIAFIPLQRKMEVLVGEPTLAFFCAYNKSKRTLLGVSTYNISPPEATNYLNKIQCFCFEEQRFKPNELVELPVFFYIHKDFQRDPILASIRDVVLSYTFFSLERTREMISHY